MTAADAGKGCKVACGRYHAVAESLEGLVARKSWTGWQLDFDELELSIDRLPNLVGYPTVGGSSAFDAF